MYFTNKWHMEHQRAIVITLEPAKKIPEASPTVKGNDKKDENNNARKNIEGREEDGAENQTV
eukprot:8994692-Ditylum_brightwellii.AAC.1